MSLALYAAFVAATTVLMLIPGPNVALIVANSLAHGARYGLMTVAGTSAAMVAQLTATALGLSPAGVVGVVSALSIVAAVLLAVVVRRPRLPA